MPPGRKWRRAEDEESVKRHVVPREAPLKTIAPPAFLRASWYYSSPPSCELAGRWRQVSSPSWKPMRDAVVQLYYSHAPVPSQVLESILACIQPSRKPP